MTNKSKRRIKPSAIREAEAIDRAGKKLGNPLYTHHHNQTCKHPEVRLVGTRQGIVEVCVHCATTWKQEDEHTY